MLRWRDGLFWQQIGLRPSRRQTGRLHQPLGRIKSVNVACQAVQRAYGAGEMKTNAVMISGEGKERRRVNEDAIRQASFACRQAKARALERLGTDDLQDTPS